MTTVSAVVFLTGGIRYAIGVITAADHWLATAAGASYQAGTLFYVLDGAYQQGDAARDIMFSLYQASFATSRTVIDLNPLSLAGAAATREPVSQPGLAAAWVPVQARRPVQVAAYKALIRDARMERA